MENASSTDSNKIHRKNSEIATIGDECGIEEGLRETGSCGRFQIVLQSLTMYFVLTIAYTTNFSYYILDNPGWKCVRNDTSPFCRKNYGKIFLSHEQKFKERCRLNRSEWMYSTEKTYSGVTEFDLVCDKAPLAALASSMVFIGGLIGALTTGKLADKYGRLPVMIVSLFFQVITTISCSFVPNVWFLIALRGVLGAVFNACFNIAMVYMMEFVPSRFRAFSGSLYQFTYCVSLLLITLVAYYVRYWRDYSRFIAYPASLSFLLVLLLPESPRWLLAANKKTHAEKILKRVARYNGVSIKDGGVKLKTKQCSGDNEYSFLHLFRYAKLLLITSVLGLLWMVTSMLYFAIGLESSKLGGDMYLVYVYSTLAEMPGTLSAPILCDHVGRKKTILISIMAAGVATLSISFVPRGYSLHHDTLNILLAIIAKFFINIAYVSIFVWSFEIYPTVIRSQGLSTCAIFDRIGGLTAPFIVRLLHNFNYNLPFITMGAISIAAGLLGCVLPETNKMPTREKFEDLFTTKVHKPLQKDIGHNNEVVELELSSCTYGPYNNFEINEG